MTLFHTKNLPCNAMKKFYIQTLGCKVNQFESASFQSGLEARGCHPAENASESRAVIINTCAVTGKAGAQSRQAIRRAARAAPHARVIITGCYAQLAADDIGKMPELRDRKFVVIGNESKDILVDAVLDDASPPPPGNIDLHTKICALPVRKFSGRTRATLRIQDGCNSQCSYCIVPRTRGRSRSLPAAQVLRQALVFREEGHREIVITGIHAGAYGRELDEG